MQRSEHEKLVLAMIRYFLNIREDGDFIPDEEGQEFVDPAEMALAALKAARELVAVRVIEGRPIADGAIEVTDKWGKPVLVQDFRDAFSV